MRLPSDTPLSLKISHVNTNLRIKDDDISYLETSDPSQPYTTPDNVLAYRPNFANSSTAILFINLEAIFPCYRADEIAPACQIFTFDKVSFHYGKPYIQVSDTGNNFHIFSNSQNIATYGFGIMDCPTMDLNCGAVKAQLLLVCLLSPALNECGT